VSELEQTEIMPLVRANAGEVLFGLLATRTAYRRQWERFEQRKRSNKISCAAVSRVVSHYLWESSQRPDTDTALHRRLKDRVARALDGKKTTHETLNWIMEAFSFSDEDQETVWSAFSDGPITENEGEGIAFTLRDPKPPMNRTQRHRTTALFKRYYIGGNKMLRQAESNHVITALDDGLGVYGHSPRDNLKELRCISGGKRVVYYPSVPGFVGMDIELERPLAKNRTASLQYVATYNPTDGPCTEVRRAARARTHNVDIRVCFEGLSPRRAWWCVWDDHVDGEALRREPAEIKRGELHRFVPYIEQTVVGFEWEW
jgi:hypothetical protein